MTITTSPLFQRALAALSGRDRLRAERTVSLLFQSAGRHPGLRVKRIHQRGPGMLEARVNNKVRIYFTLSHSTLHLYEYEGTHDRLNSPSRRRA